MGCDTSLACRESDILKLYTVIGVTLAASTVWIFPQYQTPPMPIVRFKTITLARNCLREKIIYITRLTLLSCIYLSSSSFRGFQNTVFMGFLGILCKNLTLFLTIFYKTVHEFIPVQLKKEVQNRCTDI